jgi:hypothetical protein
MLLHDLIDEKFLTVSPLEVGLHVPGPQQRTPCASARSPLGITLRPTAFALGGLTKEQAINWEWLSCRKVGDHQFHRLRRRRDRR